MWTSLRREAVPHAGRVHAALVDRPTRDVRPPPAAVRLRRPSAGGAGPAAGGGGARRVPGPVAHPTPLQLRLHLPAAEVPPVPGQERHLHVVRAPGARGARGCHVAACERPRVRGGGGHRHPEYLVVGFHRRDVDLHHLRRLPRDLDRLLYGGVLWSLGLPQVVCFFWNHALVIKLFYFSTFFVLI